MLGIAIYDQRIIHKKHLNGALKKRSNKMIKKLVFQTIIIFLCVGCSQHKEMSLSKIIEDGKQSGKPTLLFLSDPSSKLYSHFKKILEEDEVKDALKQYHWVEQETSSIQWLNHLLYGYRTNYFLILNGDSIASAIPHFYSSKGFVEFLKDAHQKSLAETLKHVSLLQGDKVSAARVMNHIFRATYRFEIKEMTRADYSDAIRQSLKVMPYFYNRYLLATLTEDYSDVGWLDSLTTAEKNIYADCIKELNNKRYGVPIGKHSDIRLNENVIDLGEVPLHGKDSCVFTLTNQSEIPTIIYKVKTTCGCTVAEWQKTPIRKDESSSIKIVFTGESKGFFKKASSCLPILRKVKKN